MNVGKLVSGILVAVMVASIALLANAALTSANNTVTLTQVTSTTAGFTRLSVTGYGTLTYKPDQAVLTFGVIGQGDTAEEALGECSSKADAVVEALKRIGISEEDMKTTGISVSPRYDWDVKPPRIVGYEAHYSLYVRVRDIDLVGKAIDTAIKAGVDTLGGLSFTLSEDAMQSLQKEVIKLAIDDARARAEAAAEALGMKIVGVESITLSPSYTPTPRLVKAEAAEGGAPPILPGEGKLSATVSIIYLLQ